MRVGIVSNSWLRARNGIANIFIRLTFCFHAAKPVFLNVHSLFLSLSLFVSFPLAILTLPSNNRR